MSEPRTEAGKALANGGVPMGETREWFTADIYKVEAEATHAALAPVRERVEQLVPQRWSIVRAELLAILDELDR